MPYQNITPVKLGLQAISTTPTKDTPYTVPAATRAMVKDIDICNTTAGALTVEIYLVPSGGAPSTGNALIYNASIPANSVFQWTGSIMLNAGDTIRTSASGAGLTAHFSGGEAI